MKRPEMFESYEEMWFALLMEQVSQMEGEELLAKNEELKNDPAAAVPEALDKKCRETIQKSFAKQKRRSMAARAYRVFEKVAVAVFVIGVLFSAVWAMSPQTRLATLNFLEKVSDISTGLTFGDIHEKTNDPELNILSGYIIPWMPEGFYLDYSESDDRTEFQFFENGQDANISIQVVHSEDTAIHNVDTENIDSAEKTDINSFTALIVEKDSRVQITLIDEERYHYIDIIANGIDRETVLNIAKGIKAVE